MKFIITSLVLSFLMTSVVFAETVTTNEGIVFDKSTGTVIDFIENECSEIELPVIIEDVVVSGFDVHNCSNDNLKKLIIPESIKKFNISMVSNEIEEIYFYTKDCEFNSDEPFYAGGRGNLKIYGYVNSTIYDVIPQWYFQFIALDEGIEQGDINCDGYVDASDAALLLQKVLKSTIRVEAQYLKNSNFVMDITDNGSIAADDCAAILQKVLKG